MNIFKLFIFIVFSSFLSCSMFVEVAEAMYGVSDSDDLPDSDTIYYDYIEDPKDLDVYIFFKEVDVDDNRFPYDINIHLYNNSLDYVLIEGGHFKLNGVLIPTRYNYCLEYEIDSVFIPSDSIYTLEIMLSNGSIYKKKINFNIKTKFDYYTSSVENLSDEFSVYWESDIPVDYLTIVASLTYTDSTNNTKSEYGLESLDFYNFPESTFVKKPFLVDSSEVENLSVSLYPKWQHSLSDIFSTGSFFQIYNKYHLPIWNKD